MNIFNAYKSVKDGVIYKQAFGVSEKSFRRMRRTMIDTGFEQVSPVKRDGNHIWCQMKFVGRKNSESESD